MKVVFGTFHFEFVNAAWYETNKLTRYWQLPLDKTYVDILFYIDKMYLMGGEL